MAQQTNDFSQGSIPKNILALALPMTAAQLINVLYSVVDRIYLGLLPGHLALTGLGLTVPVISIIMGFANLCGTGGAPLSSMERGRGNQEEAERVKAEKEETRTTSDNVTVESSDTDGVELARKMGQEIAQGQAKVVNGLTNYM